MHSRYILSPTQIAIAACVVPTAATEESPAPQPATSTHSTIVITASGTDQDNVVVPVTINTITAADAAAVRPMWLGEALNRVPGVYIVQLRGVVDAPIICMPLSYNNYHLYLQDGIPLQSSVAYNHSAFAYSAATTSFGGIEVLKGPGTALYGSDAVSSVINVKSRTPTEQSYQNLSVAGSSYGSREIKVEAGGGIGGGHALGAVVTYSGEDGWRDNTGWFRYQGVARDVWHRGETTIDTALIATRFEAEMAGPISRDQFLHDITSDGLAASVSRHEAVESEDYIRLSSKITTPISDRATLDITPYVRFIDQSYMAVWEPDTTPVTTEDNTTGGLLARVYLNHKTNGVTIFGIDIEDTQITSKVTQSRANVTGIYGFFTSYQGTQYSYTVDYLNISPYIQHEQTFGNWIATAGLRYDNARYVYDNKFVDGQIAFDDFRYRPSDKTDRFHQLSPKAGLTYLISDDQSAFARYAHGFRLPSHYNLYALAGGSATFDLQPERFDSGEVGWKVDDPNGLRGGISAYYTRARDGIVPGVSTSAGEISANGGRFEYKGIEIEAAMPFGHDLELGVSYAYSQHKVIQKLASGSDPADGKQPMNAPNHLANVRLAWTPEAVTGLRIEPEAQYLGRWYIDEANTRQTPDVLIANVRAAYAVNRNWTLDLKILNVFDTTYAAADSVEYGSENIRPGQPMTAVVGIEASF